MTKLFIQSSRWDVTTTGCRRSSHLRVESDVWHVFPRTPRGDSVWHHRRSVRHPQPPFSVAKDGQQPQQPKRRIPCAASATAWWSSLLLYFSLLFSPSLIPFRARAELLVWERVSGCVAPISGESNNPDNPILSPIYQWQAEQEVCALAGRWRRVRIATNVSLEGKKDRKEKKERLPCDRALPPAFSPPVRAAPFDSVPLVLILGPVDRLLSGERRWQAERQPGVITAECSTKVRWTATGSSLLFFSSHLSHLCGNGLIICLSTCLVYLYVVNPCPLWMVVFA